MSRHPLKKWAKLALILLAAVGLCEAVQADTGRHEPDTTSPIKHLVVIFQENVSFDHYFAAYPNAANSDGSAFWPKPGTPTVNGLNEPLLAPNNPNSAQPFRLSYDQAETCDQDHAYTDEQKAFDNGLMDKFVETVGVSNTVKVGIPPLTTAVPCAYGLGKGLVMGYYDGNTVTALWNYAQNFAMNDNSYSTGFGPSSPGALNLVSGQTHGFATTSSAVTANNTVIGDPQPTGDICDTRDNTTSIDPNNKNIGDLLNAKGVTWGWFQGGFRESSGTSAVTGQPTSNTCQIGHSNEAGVFSADYIPHHEPFQYFASTANLQHLSPTSVSMIGRTDQANHQYDLTDFWNAVGAHRMPAVSFLKAPGYQDGHAGYSDPLDEQQFIVDTINRLEKTGYWDDTAVIILYDDSDGWYDHQMGPIINQSNDSAHDALRGTDCGTNANLMAGGYPDRCGYGPRQPLLVVSPYAKTNFVDHTVTDQTSVLRFIEDNWQTGGIGNGSLDEKAGTLLNMFNFGRNQTATKLFLDPATGLPVRP